MGPPQGFTATFPPQSTSSGQQHNLLLPLLFTRGLVVLRWGIPCKISAEKSPDIKSHWIDYYSLNTFNFKHYYSLPFLLGPFAEHPEHRPEDSAMVAGDTEQLVPLSNQFVFEGRIKRSDHTTVRAARILSENAVGVGLAPWWLKYHRELCFSFCKSNTGYCSRRDPSPLGLATFCPIRQKTPRADLERCQQRASVCPHTPAADPCTGDFDQANPEHTASSVKPRTEQLSRTRWSMAFTPSPVPTTTCAQLLHTQTSVPCCSFTVLPFTPTDYLGFCLNLFLCASTSHLLLKYFLCKQVSFPGKQGEEPGCPWGQLPVKQASHHLQRVPHKSRGC